ncbi:hypothetical protein V5799_020389 [Amblyomma americanum]|uniref:Uncharacterized protein n=1 Tax=Amblyomma americanum TaxID=6943 RepID=A0AAQ4D9Y6_AMBAM
MDNERKRRLAALAVILDVTEDNEETGWIANSKRSCWVKPWLTKKTLGVQNQLYEELLATDPEEYKRLLRLSSDQFYQLLARVQPRIERQDTVMRGAVPAKTRLQVTLRFLASGERYRLPYVSRR